MLKEFWLDVIRQHTDLVDGVLTLKTNMKFDVDLFALEIKFRDDGSSNKNQSKLKLLSLK